MALKSPAMRFVIPVGYRGQTRRTRRNYPTAYFIYPRVCMYLPHRIEWVVRALYGEDGIKDLGAFPTPRKAKKFRKEMMEHGRRRDAARKSKR